LAARKRINSTRATRNFALPAPSRSSRRGLINPPTWPHAALTRYVTRSVRPSCPYPLCLFTLARLAFSEEERATPRDAARNPHRPINGDQQRAAALRAARLASSPKYSPLLSPVNWMLLRYRAGSCTTCSRFSQRPSRCQVRSRAAKELNYNGEE